MSIQWHPTPSNPCCRLVIDYLGTLKKFLKIELNLKRDGSLYIFFQRAGKSEVSYTWKLGETPTQTSNPVEKGIKVSYHTSGMVNPHFFGEGPFFCEPLYEITRPQLLAVVSTPSPDSLDNHVGTSEISGKIVCEHQGRLSFEVLIAPISFDWGDRQPLLQVEVSSLCTICLFLSQLPVGEPQPGFEKHFIYLAPTKGPFGEIKVKEDEAFIRFHQHITGATDVTIYGPNGSGEYLLVFSVPMRIAPEVNISLYDKSNTAEVIHKTNHYIKYKIKDKHGHAIKTPTEIASVELNARL